MGNSVSGAARKVLPIDTLFTFPSQLPTWPKDEGFASGSINLGELEVCQISTFNKVWATLQGGPGNLGATFFEPSPIPDGFFMLGCYAQPNNTPLFGWVLAGKGISNDTPIRALMMPVDYTLVWSSESMMSIKKEGNGFFWLPTPPEGYSAVGLVVTNSPDKPPLDKVRCVRSDLVDSCEQNIWIWGEDKASDTSDINVYGLRPNIRGTNALGVQVGTFIVDGTTASLSLSCLKNINFNLSYMPNLTQIDELVQAYSPRIYFHRDESYLPSSVNWYFNQGVLLYQQGNVTNPVLVEPNGLNLPQGGSNDGTYWLDLPTDENTKERVKKGDLQSSMVYLHIKPMLGATFTDIAMWIFYPFNGPARAKVQLIDIPLGKIGEHIGDWEHLTLRISNFTGDLWRVYMSQHSTGIWANASELEFESGNKVVAHATLSGHAIYPKEGLVLQGNATLGIGIRNDAAKSDIVMDTGIRYEVVSAEYLSTLTEPAWLNYTRKWGPRISYSIANEISFVENLIPGDVDIIGILPAELLGEDGPTGPKMKNNWNGDEAI
ncbi:vacuolar sorting-associated protein [Thalictrum thalictroides]|uniref:Vacuolar sorting-associated protein n=1 Tax=Thalictrum thalictroides TaxID=46969 RepID=A0A7J6UYF8_THATH|nr:vacuolar sorting-associated protein [Thalictrum thalictroides]